MGMNRPESINREASFIVCLKMWRIKKSTSLGMFPVFSQFATD
jgi:hypothetical protein